MWVRVQLQSISYMEILLMAFSKRSCLWNSSFKRQTGASSQLWIRCMDCVATLLNERRKFGHFDPKLTCPHNFEHGLKSCRHLLFKLYHVLFTCQKSGTFADISLKLSVFNYKTAGFSIIVITSVKKVWNHANFGLV